MHGDPGRAHSLSLLVSKSSENELINRPAIVGT